MTPTLHGEPEAQHSPVTRPGCRAGVFTPREASLLFTCLWNEPRAPAPSAPAQGGDQAPHAFQAVRLTKVLWFLQEKAGAVCPR